jgi:hypothetical protein
MERKGFIIGMTVLAVMVFSFIPFLAWLNFLNVPLAIIGLIISISAILKASDSDKSYLRYSIIACSAAILVGVARLIIGVGFI